VFGHGAIVRDGTVIMALVGRAFSVHGVVVTGASGDPKRGEAEAPLPVRRREELLGGVLYHGLPQGWCPAAS
jgi:hypothetical protein